MITYIRRHSIRGNRIAESTSGRLSFIFVIELFDVTYDYLRLKTLKNTNRQQGKQGWERRIDDRTSGISNYVIK